MSKTPRYQRRANDPAENNQDTSNQGGELATGVPIEPGVPAGSPQFDTYKQYAREQSERAALDDDGPIEDRDGRGSNPDNDKRVPITQIDELATEMAGKYTTGEHKVRSRADGNTLTVSITTVHGTSNASADVEDWSEAGVKKALKEIEEKLNGKADGDDKSPEKQLADAVKAVKG